MNYPWMEEYFLGKKGCIRVWHEPWGVYKYMVEDKMIAMEGHDKEKTEIITLKLEPINGELMRREYPEDIKPGYYMNKVHWNSVNLNGNVPEKLLKSMIDETYIIGLNSLTKKKREQYI